MYKILFVSIGTFVALIFMMRSSSAWEYNAEAESYVKENTKEFVESKTATTTATTTPKVASTSTSSVPIIIKPKPEPQPTPIPKSQTPIKYGITQEECSLRVNNSPFYYDSSMQSVKKVKELFDAGKIRDAEILREISCTPQAIWLSGQDSNFTKEKIRKVIDESKVQNKIPVFVLYNGPNNGTIEWRHTQSGEVYERWVRLVADTIKDDEAWVIVEPDALSLSYSLSENDRTFRLSELNKAVSILVTYAPNARVYIDAGHSNWKSEKIAADSLLRAGVKFAHGFSLNVSNYQTTESQVAYGKKLSELISGKHFIVDTSRNGNGPPIDNEWCNPNGRAIGQLPTINTNEALADAFLWVKLPGESDGYCNGGTAAGNFWLEYALDLVKNK